MERVEYSATNRARRTARRERRVERGGSREAGRERRVERGGSREAGRGELGFEIVAEEQVVKTGPDRRR
jgi:hypothetical protein